MTDNPPSILWTRPNLYWEEDALKLQEKKLSVLRAPAIKYQKLDFSLPPLEKSVFILTNFFSAFLFTQELSGKQKDPLVYTMSLKAFEHLRKEGVKAILLESQRAKDFARLLESNLEKNTPNYLVGPEKRAFDMNSHLLKKGYLSKNINCYRTLQNLSKEDETKFSEKEKLEISRNKKTILCFFSPSAVQSFLGDFSSHHQDLKKSVRALAIGKTTFKACEQFFPKCSMAKRTSVESMIESLLELR